MPRTPKPSRERPTHQCTKCEATFPTMTRLVTHRVDAHPLDEAETDALWDRFERRSHDAD